MNMENKTKLDCVGFILDGNRRWARNKDLPTLEGHSKGLQGFQGVIKLVHKEGIPHMVAYMFSTENWNRSDEEVEYLMTLFRSTLAETLKDIRAGDKKIRIRVIGQTERLPKDLQTQIQEIEGGWEEPETPDLTVWAAISYGGRAEIVDAVNRCVKKGEQVNEETFSEQLWTAGMPDPDIIVRTSGEYRLSNFLLWQAAYSELLFVNTPWPDFGEEEFQSMLEEYAARKRRKGK